MLESILSIFFLLPVASVTSGEVRGTLKELRPVTEGLSVWDRGKAGLRPPTLGAASSFHRRPE